MPRSEKWLAELDADRSTLDIAQAVLGQRLKAMKRLIGAASSADDDVEAVHELRVWTRRTEAALVLFKPLLPKKRRKRMRMRLRRLRSSAGEVRDCDVHWKHLNDEPNPNRSLLRALKRDRKEARKELRQVQQKLAHKKWFAQKSRKLVQRLDESELLGSACRGFRAFARQAIEEQASVFFQTADLAGADDEALHSLRIAAKRWRYALELAAGVLEKPWAGEMYEQLSDLQDRLGDVHDLEALCGRIERALAAETGPRRRAKLREVLEQQRERLDQRRSAFFQWWSAEQREQLLGLWKRASVHAAKAGC